MKIIVNILATIVLIVSIAFTVLPMDSVAFLPIIATAIIAAISFFVLSPKKQKWEKYILLICVVLAIVVSFKLLFIKDEVVIDEQYQQEQAEKELEDIQDLEELEGL